MAGGMAKTSLIGNLGKDPELKFTGGGTAVCNMRVAVTEKVKKGDEWVDGTTWFGVVCFGKLAENVSKFCKKGKQIYADGRLQIREWQDKEGKTRTDVEVVASSVLFLGGGGERTEKPEAAKESDAAPFSDDQIPF